MENKEIITLIMKHYGLNPDDEFMLDGKKVTFIKDDDNVYRLFSEYGPVSNDLLYEFINGIAKVEKRPWMPKNGDRVWTVTDTDVASIMFNDHSPFKVAAYKCGWLFPTREDALEHRDRVFAEMVEVKKECEQSLKGFAFEALRNYKNTVS